MSRLIPILSLGAVLFLSACSSKKCESVFLGYKYLNKVKIEAGFYAGQVGVIIGQAWIYTDLSSCNIPAFNVKLNSTGEVISVDQSNLEGVE